jgi:RHH-type proline utilization regulon transcriptional repressor/proline dehydrogenase/delta 1-pyrroline-5-carboxylate dehydrogenase
LDVLGEAVITEQEAQAYLDRYLNLITELGTQAKQWKTVAQIDEADQQPLSRAQVSVKLTAFYSQFDPLDAQGSAAKVSDAIRQLLRHAQTMGVALHFDMEQYRYKDLTLDILKQILLEPEFRDWDDVGLTLQAYLRDSEQDLQSLITWAKGRGTPVTVRLIKGAYWDQETILAVQQGWPQPVYNHKGQTDANFETLTELLLSHHAVLYGAIGSHNARSQAHALAIAQALEIPRRRFECQVLYGMGDKLGKAIAAQGHRVRVYCPYGQLLPGMAYLIRRLLENTANSSFLKQSLEKRATDELIAPPTLPDGETIPEGYAGFANAADRDFAQGELRDQASQALQSVRQQLGQTYWPLINGQYQPCDQTITSVNPANSHEIIGEIGLISTTRADQALAAAKAAFPQWRRTPVPERVAILNRAADLMEERRAQLSAWIMLEVGKPLRQADGEVSEAIDFCRYYGQQMERLSQGHVYDYPGETNHLHYQPCGIAVVISPWNFPLAIATGMTVATLVTGNCTLLKPAATATVIAAQLAKILVEAGMPPGVFQLIPGKGSQIGPYLVKHPDVHLITFTGSQEVGCQIYADAAIRHPQQHHLKRVVAEMGGKNTIIVDESADLDQVVVGIVNSAFGYSGQKCSACSRVVAVESIYETLVERVVEATRSLNVGPAENPETQVGPVIDVMALQRIRTYIQQGEAEATLALAMPAPSPGYFVGPTVFKDVPPMGRSPRRKSLAPSWPWSRPLTLTMA